MNAANAQHRDPDRTRHELLEAAFDEIYLRGFQAASLDRILQRTGLTKGALYHHFKNKTELGYAVLEEVIKPMMTSAWTQALTETDDPLTAITQVIGQQHEIHGEDGVICGCPLNNLAQEMSPIDEGFRTRIQTLLESWRRAIASALRQGQAHDTVRPDVDPDQVATFILAAIEGTIGLCKNAQSTEVFQASVGGLEVFLEALRPRTTA